MTVGAELQSLTAMADTSLAEGDLSTGYLSSGEAPPLSYFTQR